MNDSSRTKDQLIEELTELRRKLSKQGEANSKRKRTEEELRFSEERFRALSDATFEGVVFARDGVIFDCNKQFTEIAGYSQDELKGFDDLKLVHPDDVECVRQHISGESEEPYEVRFVRKDGSIRNVEVLGRMMIVNGEKSRVAAVRDITEKKHARELISRFGRILDNSSNEIYIFDADSLMFIQVNEGARKNLGYSNDELRKLTPVDLKPELTLETFTELLRPLLGGEKDHLLFETLHKRKDGSLYPVEVRLQLSFEEKPPVFVAIIQDITERKRADEELRESDKRTSLAQKIGKVGIWDWDPNSGELIWSDEVYNIFGLAPGEIKPTYEIFLEMLHPDDRALVASSVEETLYQKKPCNLNCRIIRTDGVERIAKATGEGQFDENGKPIRMLGTFIDITERKQAETLIARLGRIIEDSINEVVVFDFETLKYLEANHGAITNMGYSMEELTELTPADIKPHVDLEEFERIIEPLTSGKVNQIEFQAEHRRKDGSTYFAEIHMQMTLFKDKPAFVSIILDVTERIKAREAQKELEAQLQQTQKMEAIGMLAAGVAHDFNNILTVIGLHSESAMSDIGEEHPAFNSMKEALEASKSASVLTRQLLLFSRKQTLEFTANDLNITVGGLQKMLNRLIGEDIEIKTDLDASLNMARLDRGSMEQVIMNLSINARDAMQTGGSITIKTKNKNFSKEECLGYAEAFPGDFVHLSISDTGIGMDAETADHIFEPFYSTKEPGKGTGLGLSVVYGIIKQHNGWIKVKSKEGKGTTFNIYIPVEIKGANKEISKETAKENGKNNNLRGEGKRILLVEDNNGLRIITVKILKDNGFIIFEAENARLAETIFEKESGDFDLILSDVVMPGGSGIELIESLLKKKTNLKVLLTSGYTDERSQLPLIRERKYRFIQKPYNASELLLAVKEAL